MKKVISAGLLILFLMTGCAGMTDTQQRALSGAMIGAGGGAVIGALTGGPAIGAAIGAGVGTAAGLVVDNNEKKKATHKTARKASKTKSHRAAKSVEDKEI